LLLALGDEYVARPSGRKSVYFYRVHAQVVSMTVALRPDLLSR
jgi:hypothetical protein